MKTKHRRNLKMKKAVAFTLALVLVLSLAACGGNKSDASGGDKNTPSANSGGSSGGDNNAGGNGGDSNDGINELFEFGEEYINNHLPAEYWIVYSITTYQNGETDNVTMEQIRTPEGYYWASGDDDGMILIKNGDNYDVYMKYDDVYENMGMSYNKEIAELMMIGISTYMQTYAMYGSSLDRAGSQTVAGRDCEVYAFDYTYPVLGYKYKYTYCIDKATGVCLKSQIAIDGAGEKIGYEFECTKFQTSGVALPKYK